MYTNIYIHIYKIIQIEHISLIICWQLILSTSQTEEVRKRYFSTFRMKQIIWKYGFLHCLVYKTFLPNENKPMKKASRWENQHRSHQTINTFGVCQSVSNQHKFHLKLICKYHTFSGHHHHFLAFQSQKFWRNSVVCPHCNNVF